MKDESYLFIPTSPILKTTSKASTIVTKESIIQADKLYLQAGIKADNILRTKVIPNMKDGYYRGKNFVYDPENIMKTYDFLQGFDAKYPRIETKKPFINPNMLGYSLRKILDAHK